jgi:adenylylsulfate kinase
MGITIWLTGLPSSGKTTIADQVCAILRTREKRVEVLDGDSLRTTLSKGLGFSKEDRYENIRRIAFVAELLARNGVIVLVAAISPYRELRAEIRQKLGDFVEVYVNAPIDVCEQRDVKGLYRLARKGKLRGLTGVDDPYECPLAPEVECLTSRETPVDSAAKVIDFLERQWPQSIKPQSAANSSGLYAVSAGQ